MTVKWYCLKFNQLAKYASDLMDDTQTSMSKFLTGVFDLVLQECRGALLNREMDFSRLMIHE